MPLRTSMSKRSVSPLSTSPVSHPKKSNAAAAARNPAIRSVVALICLPFNPQRRRHSFQSREQALHMRLGMRRGARDSQQVLGGGGAQNRIDINAFREQRFAQSAQGDFILEDHRDDGGLARQHV